MSLRHRPPPQAQTSGNPHPPYGSNSSLNPPQGITEEPYNIIPIQNLLALVDHPSFRYPEIRAAAAALRAVDELRKPLSVQWREEMDLLDWLGAFFGFQRDNVRNQREHLVLQLANAQMRLQLPPDNIDSLDPGVLRRFRCKVLENYTSWCSYLGRKSNLWISENSCGDSDNRRELLYVSLYLLIWGESSNLRFLPECICYIFHHMAMELNQILEDYIDENTGRPAEPSITGENAFLNKVVKPIYQTISAEVENSKNGTAPHSAWRNYDDINEYFWSNRCFEKLKWPFDLGSNFFVTTSQGRRVGKTGFVEQRSFWNLFRSFDKLWLMLILFLQASIITAWDQEKYPWQAWGREEVQIRILSVFLTWSGLRFLQSLLDAGMQYSLVSRETMSQAIRLVLKIIVAAGWIIVFSVFYSRMWRQKRLGRQARNSIVNFLEVVVVFLIPEILSLVLFIIPWMRNLAKNKNWRIFYLSTWWFQSRTFVGHGLREGRIDNIKYSLFWIVVLLTKFAFSYVRQLKPMINPTKNLLNLKNMNYEWHEFFYHSNMFAVWLLWLPVVLIYLLDLQIWYSIYSSLVGGCIGILEHIGEIRNMQQFRWRFQLFASAIQFYLMPEEQLPSTMGTPKSKFRDAMSHLKVRHGLGTTFKKLESNQVDAHKFALIWNEIIAVFREEDIISDRELELLEIPRNTWNVRVIHWPCVLLCNKLLLALDQARKLEDAPDKWIWYKMCKNEYRSCAVTEAYDSIRHLLLEIVKRNAEEHSFITVFFQTIDNSIQIEKFTQIFNLKALPQIHGKLKTLLEILVKPKKDVSKVVNILQALYEVAVRDFYKGVGSIDQLRDDGLAPRNPDSSKGGLLFENAVALPDSSNEAFYRQVRRLHTLISSHDSMHNIPTNLEARRRIAFFSNSLFMNIPHAPQVQKMMTFSVLTPYYNEEVLYSKEQLRTENEDGISILYYLQTIYADEWKNFLERMRREGMANDNEIYAERIKDLRLWASFRGQTLSRTVRGMMYYYRALKMLAFLDSASEMDIREGSRGLASDVQRNGSVDRFSSDRHPSTTSLSRTDSAISMLFKGHEHGTAIMKYTYVVACQIYGSQKAKKDPRAEEILYLMKTNEALRVAYVDEVSSGRDEKEYYSVLVKYDQELEREVEIYRVRLPGPFKLGEGKPENQNHALIFTRGDAVQTIDMNQDNYFEEALKMRNLLEEYKRPYGIRKPTLLGVREHIFTGSVSSLAWFMSSQETSFVTMWQRVLANPLKVRMHYGHPDVFGRIWFLTRGGISKASRVINISEDIFAGFNCTLRGGNVTHHEYIQVGKGRDVGFNQISLFETKVASGSGEQALSRDVYRLGHSLDFFRMLSFFYTTVGFFFNTHVVILTVYVFLWGRLYLALSGLEASGFVKYAKDNKALATILYQQFIVQLGVFTALPMIVEKSLEQGFLGTVADFIPLNLQLTSVFYAFSMGTRAHNFGRTILHGGAKYRETGRGFVVQHKSFAENYRLYARSHFVKAIELGLILMVYACYTPTPKTTLVYITFTITSWFLVVSWVMAPFVFNPSGFDWLKNVYDFDDFMAWIWYPGGLFSKPEQSWERWWLEEQDHLRTTGSFSKVVEIALDLRFFFFQYGIVYRLGIANHSKSVAVYLLSWIFVGAAIGIYLILAHAHNRYAANSHLYYRLLEFLFFISCLLVIVALLESTHFEFLDLFKSLPLFLPSGWGLILIAQVLRPAIQNTMVWEIVVSIARQYEILFGVMVFAPVAILSWLPGFQSMQTRILFNEAFSRGLQISQILKGKTKKSNRT